MIQWIKHFAFRIWATILLGGLFSLAGLSVWPIPENFVWLLLPVAVIFSLMFFLIGWISNHLGAYQMDRLREEAAVWERAGESDEAEAVFKKALALCDSFLLAPRSKKKSAIALRAQMARFYLARADKSPVTESFILSYLESNPGDIEFAENWLLQMDSRQLLNWKHQDIAYRIGNAVPANIQIQQLLANLYLSARRTDFPAQQVYRRALSTEGTAFADIIRNLAGIFLDEGRADERALDIYLKAYPMDRNNEKILNGIAACAHWIPKSEKTAGLLYKAHQLLDGISETKLKVMRAGFVPPPLPVPDGEEKKALNTLKTGFSLSRRFLSALWVRLQFIIQGGLRTISKRVHILKTSREIRKRLKWSGVGILAVGMIVLIVNTFGYFVKTAGSDKEQKRVVESAVTDRFTLQVAAYLKPEQAKEYVATLKKMNIDAFWTEAVGKNKNWYQVRVSHFPDKKSAVAYGEALKSKGVIDDYFVANY